MGEPMDYSSNSNDKRKQAEKKKERPEVKKVVSGEVTERKKGFGSKFKSIFFGGDFKSAASYVAADVLLPALRNMLADASKGAVDRVIYGDTRRTTHVGGRANYSGRTQYNNPINRAARPDPRLGPQHSYRSGRQDPTEIVLADRDDAEVVLERLGDIVDQYETACLADLYDLVGLSSNHTDQKWGWTSMHGSSIVQIREGYLLQLPPIEAL